MVDVVLVDVAVVVDVMVAAVAVDVDVNVMVDMVVVDVVEVDVNVVVNVVVVVDVDVVNVVVVVVVDGHVGRNGLKRYNLSHSLIATLNTKFSMRQDENIQHNTGLYQIIQFWHPGLIPHGYDTIMSRVNGANHKG